MVELNTIDNKLEAAPAIDPTNEQKKRTTIKKKKQISILTEMFVFWEIACSTLRFK